MLQGYSGRRRIGDVRVTHAKGCPDKMNGRMNQMSDQKASLQEQLAEPFQQETLASDNMSKFLKSDISEFLGREQLYPLFAALVDKYDSGDLPETEAREELGDLMIAWNEVSTGETQWLEEIVGSQKGEYGSIVVGGDFLRDSRDERTRGGDNLFDNVYRILEMLYDNVVDSDQTSICDTCCRGVDTNHDSPGFLVTDGAIYCHECAGEMVREAVVKNFTRLVVGSEIQDSSTSAILGIVDIHALLSGWDISIPAKILSSADYFPLDSWDSEFVCDYGQGITGITRSEARDKIEEYIKEGRVCCFIRRGSYRSDILVWSNEEIEAEGKVN